MGTDPPTQIVNTAHAGEIDYTALDSEYRQLTSQIHNLAAPSKAPAPEQQLLITAQVKSLLSSLLEAQPSSMVVICCNVTSMDAQQA